MRDVTLKHARMLDAKLEPRLRAVLKAHVRRAQADYAAAVSGVGERSSGAAVGGAEGSSRGAAASSGQDYSQLLAQEKQQFLKVGAIHW